MYPEHAKLRVVKDQTQSISGFIDWLYSEKGLFIGEYDKWDNPQPINCRWLSLVAEYFEIDEAALELEKVAMLEDLRGQHDS